MRPTWGAAVAVALALTLSGCGDDGSDDYGASIDDFCASVKDFKEATDQPVDAGGEAAEQLHSTRMLLGRLEDGAPNEVVGDWAVYAEAWRQYLAAVEAGVVSDDARGALRVHRNEARAVRRHAKVECGVALGRA